MCSELRLFFQSAVVSLAWLNDTAVKTGLQTPKEHYFDVTFCAEMADFCLASHLEQMGSQHGSLTKIGGCHHPGLTPKHSMSVMYALH